MESIINKLTEIESAASAIAEHAELQKSVLDKEYEEKRKQFDLDLEQETQAHLQKIREALEADTQTLLDQQAESNDSCVLALKKEYESRHTLYAQENESQRCNIWETYSNTVGSSPSCVPWKPDCSQMNSLRRYQLLQVSPNWFPI